MTIEAALLISVLSVAFSIFFGLKSCKRADSEAIENKARESATVNVKLDEIGKNVQDIKYDISATKKEVQQLSDRIIVVEQSVKSAHHRIDTIGEK